MMAWQQAAEGLWGAQLDEVPAGWYTVAEISDKFKISNSHACKLVRALNRAGKVAVRKFMVKSLGERKYSTPHYKLLD